ncbi:hypothetical protein HD554DRAFT_2329279 [Boletus coccyginus]|nr:hypothetical protein HD554DRAFT_2329279 [Boletus coccyginus]
MRWTTIKDDLRAHIAHIMPDFLENLSEILCIVAQTERAKRENTTEDCTIISGKALSSRHHAACKTAIELQSLHCRPLSHFLWTNGASRQIIEALARCGLCVSFTSLCQTNRHPNCATDPYPLLRQHQPKVRSGTFAILYEVKNIDWEDMRLALMLHWAQRATDLVFYANVHPTKEQLRNICYQAQTHSIDILLQGHASFKDYEHHLAPLLKHKEQRRLPKGYKTKQYPGPFRTSTVDENSGIFSMKDEE